MRESALWVICAVAALWLLIDVSGLAWGAVLREGSCSGPGEWYLRVSRESATALRVRFRIENVRPGDSWQMFLSDNGSGILARTKVADSDGEVRVGTITRDLSGTDRIKGSGVNISASGSCDGAATF